MTASIRHTKIRMTKITGVAENQYFTSGVYPYLIDDAMQSEMTPINNPFVYSIPTEALSQAGIVATVGTLESIVKTYDNPLATESMAANNIQIMSANLVVELNPVEYSNGVVELLGANNIQIVSANLVVELNPVVYNNGVVEQLGANNIQIISGTLS